MLLCVSVQECAPNSGVLVTAVPQTSSSMEDASTHWGVAVGLSPETGGRCAICTLPLIKAVSELQPGLLIFQCGKLNW